LSVSLLVSDYFLQQGKVTLIAPFINPAFLPGLLHDTVGLAPVQAGVEPAAAG
jgi:hypothetical protein